MAEEKRGFLEDKSLWLLLAANLFTLWLALAGEIAFMELLWIYWCQSIIIGFFNFLKLKDTKAPMTALPGTKLNDEEMADKKTGLVPKKTQKTMAGFFALHYGFFHLGYLIFLIVFSATEGLSGAGSQTPLDTLFLFLAIAAFFVNHLYSYNYNKEHDKRNLSMNRVFLAPYARIIPMHFTIIFGAVMIAENNASSAVALFVCLKTLADLAMHWLEHK